MVTNQDRGGEPRGPGDPVLLEVTAATPPETSGDAVGKAVDGDTVASKPPRTRRRDTIVARMRALVGAIREGDDATVQQAVLDLSRSRRILAPLAFLVGAFAMLFEGLKLLFSNWRLTLIEILPAMWIWAAMVDLKAHVLHGKSFHVVEGPVLIPVILAIVAITAACFYLNAVFAFAIAKPGPPQIRPAFTEARAHLRVISAWGVSIGLALGVSTTVFPRWGSWWFALSLSLVIAVMMATYVTVPARLVGIKSTYSKRDKLSASVVGGTMGAIVCSPAYMLGRIGLLMLGGSTTLFVFGIFVLTLGVTLQAGATGAVKAIKMSAKLVAGRDLVDPGTVPGGEPAGPSTGAIEG